MEELSNVSVDDYIIVMRIIQPARIQDIKRMYPEIFGTALSQRGVEALDNIHERMKTTGKLVPVRRGTYVLNAEGMLAAARLMKVRNMDNARLFLMKSQRSVYH